ncbi:DNA polymerase III subunit beta [Buchnera aphidicola]|uniref:DNA polymerase III subunit beta n=1 Tax=Buchnera aphidicola TaxID=9 RepID=UPI00094C1361|nr:DNA polymerase III subunit beta [Buchnera aphidicola]
MEFKIKKNDFLNPLKKIHRIITKNPIFPILENIILNVMKNKIILTSSNLEIELNAYIAKEFFFCYIPGSCLISGKKILNICRNIQNNVELHFQIIKKKIHIRALDSLFKLNTSSDKNFPKFQIIKGTKTFFLSQSILKEIISLTSFSIARNDIRTALNGMLIEYKNNYLFSVTTDGHRLSMYKKKIYLDISCISFIINKKSISELSRLLTDTTEKIQITISNHYAAFHVQETLLQTKLLNNNFPNYQDVLLKHDTFCISVSREKLKESLLKTSILCNTTFKGVCLNFSKNKLTITSNNQEDEESSDAFDINNQHEEISFSINVFYLLDSLNALHADTINIVFKIPISSIQIQTNTKKEILYIIMPLNL